MGCESCYTCGDLATQQVNVDCDPAIGNIPEAIFFKCGQLPANPDSESEVQALLDSGDAVLYTSLKVVLEAPSEITTTNTVAGETDDVSTYDRTAAYTDGNVNPTNVDAYNEMNNSNGKKFGGVLLYLCDTEQVMFINATTKLVGGVSGAENERMIFTGQIRWRSKFDPELFDWSGGIFGE